LIFFSSLASNEEHQRGATVSDVRQIIFHWLNYFISGRSFLDYFATAIDAAFAISDAFRASWGFFFRQEEFS